MTAARKQATYRRRLRAGAIVARVEVGPEIIEALLLAGRLDDAASEDRDRIATELAGVLADWGKAWRRKCYG